MTPPVQICHGPGQGALVRFSGPHPSDTRYPHLQRELLSNDAASAVPPVATVPRIDAITARWMFVPMPLAVQWNGTVQNQSTSARTRST